jgi:hypothetical protein
MARLLLLLLLLFPLLLLLPLLQVQALVSGRTLQRPELLLVWRSVLAP